MISTDRPFDRYLAETPLDVERVPTRQSLVEQLAKLRAGFWVSNLPIKVEAAEALMVMALRAYDLEAMVNNLPSPPVHRIVAKPLEWEQDHDDQWSEKNPAPWGFSIFLNASDPPTYEAYWGEGDGEECATLDEAKAWCQKTADEFIAQQAILTSTGPVTQFWLDEYDSLDTSEREAA